ncbi:asparagine synthetase B family protein [Micromonospora sp. NPDC049903]|uniref:asparagine synthetase B family protein n=1 Tax=Micromonospora sp. NPDC049903 TaxID=3364276 RepID=UPI0037A9887F
MCGIAASYPVDDAFITAALRAQATRGPDQTASVDLGFCALSVNRLAISGLDDGHQPLSSADGSVVVVFNGAIYNADRLIERHGLTPRSGNDGEIIHFLYQRYGLRFADHLEGMFAICLADLRRRELVVAVDQVGIKPLYWCDTSRGRYVASTVAAFPPELRRQVRRVPPGTVWSTSGEGRRIVHEYALRGTLGDLLTASVAEQIPGEVRWGCMLSGGVDSSLIARLATESVGAGAVETFTCGTGSSTDLTAARQVAEMLGTKHHEVIVDPDELPEIVDRVVEATGSFERWTVMAGVGTYLTARAARQEGTKVLLSGEGADELFGGYDEFQDVPTPYLDSMLLQYQADLGVSECLRLDRCTMAHGVEVRVPFLCTPVMRHARELPVADKIRTVNGVPVRKWALREFARTLLPAHVANRRKEEFTNGSGLTAELRRIAEAMFPPARVAEIVAAHPSFPIDDPFSAWFFTRWWEADGNSLGDNWQSMVDRGLFRQQWSVYHQPNGRDFALYRSAPASRKGNAE